MPIEQLEYPNQAVDQERDLNRSSGILRKSYSINPGDNILVLGMVTDGTFDPATQEAALKSALVAINGISVVGPDILMGPIPAEIYANTENPGSREIELRSRLSISGRIGTPNRQMTWSSKTNGKVNPPLGKQWLIALVKTDVEITNDTQTAALETAVENIAKIDVGRILNFQSIPTNVADVSCMIEAQLYLARPEVQPEP